MNPGVALGLAVLGHLPWGHAVGYWIAQFRGATIGSYFSLETWTGDG